MEKTKSTKKYLKELISNAVIEAISKLELPKPTRKIKKLVSRNSKKLAEAFSDIQKRDLKKKQKVEKSLLEVEAVLKGKKKPGKKKKALVKSNGEA